MKYSRPIIAGVILTVVALSLVVFMKSGPDAAQDGTTGSSAGSPGTTGTAPPPRESKFSRPSRTKTDGESPDAKELKLLWARGRGQELLVALDRLSQSADAEEWQEVSEVLQEQAARDGRHEIATYLLATGHGAPAGIRLAIYASALDNPDQDIRDSAKLELLNLTGQEFTSSTEAKSWIASHPEASRDEEEIEEEE
jgi:hypothetical protein